jgi:hypothetical protein
MHKERYIDFSSTKSVPFRVLSILGSVNCGYPGRFRVKIPIFGAFSETFQTFSAIRIVLLRESVKSTLLRSIALLVSVLLDSVVGAVIYLGKSNGFGALCLSLC